MFRLNAEEAVLVVVDIQERLLPAMSDRENVLAASEKLIKGCRLLGVPILVTQQYTQGLGETVDEIKIALTEHLDEDVPAQDFQYIEKRSFSCMDEPQFENALKAYKDKGREQVIICGIESHVCVQQTAIDIYDKDYIVYLVSDCVDSRHPFEKEIALRRTSREVAELMTMESALFEMTRSAEHSKFKSISRLVK